MAHEVADQPGILGHAARPASVGDARRLHDCRVVAHVVDDADEAVVEYRRGLEQHVLERRHGRAAGLGAKRALSLDVGKLVRSQGHATSPAMCPAGAA